MLENATKVYISSTVLDLKEYRAAAALVVHTLNHRAVGMEYDSASEMRPLDQCLAAVRGCDVYLGLFAYRYGYVVPEYKKSITRLEYEEAGRCGLDRLVFMVDKETPWPRSLMDDELGPIEAFRAHLNTAHRTDTFRNIDELSYKISAALGKLLTAPNPHRRPEVPLPPSGEPHHEPPTHLAYLLNRLEQAAQLNDTLTQGGALGPVRPIFCVLHGDELNGHDAFLERLTTHSLPQWLVLNPSHEFVLRLHIALPRAYGGPEGFERALRVGLADELRTSTAPEALARRINEHPGPVLVSSDFYPSYWADGGRQKIEGLLRFWEAWPDLPPGKRLIVFLCVRYADRGGPRGFPWFGWRSPVDGLAAYVVGLDLARHPRVRGVKLHPLGGVSLHDLRDWCKLSEVQRFCKASWLEQEVMHLFGRPEFRAYSEDVPMDVIVRELNRFLSLSPPATRVP